MGEILIIDKDKADELIALGSMKEGSKIIWCMFLLKHLS